MNEEPGMAARFRQLIEASPFPCVGAKSALAKGLLNIIVARDIRSNWDDPTIYAGIASTVRSYRENGDLFQSFAVIFEGPKHLSEQKFEHYLWKRAESLSNKDGWLGKRYDKRVSKDPNNPHFSLSFEGEAFFIVGMHPGASRDARRFENPVLVFNIHDQFERLRNEGRYEKMRQTILDRDVDYSGSINPMLARHGSISEARQYSGRQVDEQWSCPFKPVARA